MTARINPDPIALADMVSRGMTALQIGAYFNTSDTTARKWLKAYGLCATGTGSRAPKGEQFRREVEFLARVETLLAELTGVAASLKAVA